MDYLNEEYPGYKKEYAIPEEPACLDEKGIDKILKWASSIGASDVNLISNEAVVVELQGRFVRITKRRYGSSDLEMVTNIFYGGANGVAHIRSAGEIDCSHSIRSEAEGTSFQYRVNITACRAGINITIRTITGTPLSFAQLGIEPEIINSFSPENGLVFVCGKTGSGKSTLLAASVRAKVESGNNNKKILMFESPIEYVYDEVPRAADIVVQHEVPRHIASFARAVRNSLRRAPTDILIGECRDYETISASIEAAETGHVLFTTLHANSISEAFYRILNMFPQNERASKVFEIIEACRMIVAQKLVIGTSGKRVALREYLIFDQSIRDRLRHVQSLKEVVALVAKLVEEKGQTMLMSAYASFNAGLIDKHILEGLEDSGRNLVDDFNTDF